MPLLFIKLISEVPSFWLVGFEQTQICGRWIGRHSGLKQYVSHSMGLNDAMHIYTWCRSCIPSFTAMHQTLSKKFTTHTLQHRPINTRINQPTDWWLHGNIPTSNIVSRDSNILADYSICKILSLKASIWCKW